MRRRLSDVPDPVTVLVVDDHKDSRFLIGVLLRDHADIEIVGEADGAASALELLHLEPDIVLLDNRMPRVDGFEAAPMILERRPQQKIVLLTAVVDDGIEERARAAGMMGCHSKEHFETLADAVRAAASREIDGEGV
jgi:DNA-binding NarL/FixJ family response regulator